MYSEAFNQGSDIGTVESRNDFKETSGAKWKWAYWDAEIKRAKAAQKEWYDEAERTLKIYKNKRELEDKVNPKKGVYNILYSNVETLKPLLFSKLPNPRVRKRNLEKNPITKTVSIILERNIKRVLEEIDAAKKIEQARDDFLIVKRGNVKLSFKQEVIKFTRPEIQEELGEDGKIKQNLVVVEDEELGEKKIDIEYISWKKVLFSPAEKYEDVRWVAFQYMMTKDELKERFGPGKAANINLDCSVLTEDQKIKVDDSVKDIFKRAEIWMIWDKEKKQVITFSEGYKNGLLEEKEDEYELKDFFPIPRPLGIDSGVDTIQPIPDYKYYEDQAKELNDISNRILAILPFISPSGAYNAVLTTEDVKNFLNNTDGQYFPVNAPTDVDINKLIYNRDITLFIEVLKVLYEERQQVIAAIQEITGISDIVRGQTEASETATAQQLKGNFAISRIQPQQREVENFTRDIVRIIAELLSQNYSAFELAEMSQLKIYDMDKIAQDLSNQIMQIDKQRYVQGLPPLSDEERQQFYDEKLKPFAKEIKAGQATTVRNLQEVEKILKDDKLRGWAIEVETNSTIQVDENEERQAVLDFSQALSNISQQFLPLLQAGVFSKEAFKSMLSYVMRRFEGSEEVEDLLDDEAPEESKGPSIEEQLAIQESKRKDREVDIKGFAAQAKAKNDRNKLFLDEQKINADIEINDTKMSHESKSAYDMIGLKAMELANKIQQSDLINQQQ